MKPNFLIVGAAKAGTTALYYYLKQHKDIVFPNLKEPKYFSTRSVILPHAGVGDPSVDKYTISNWQEYLSLFEGLDNHKMIGEASPNYLYYHQKTAPFIKSILGDVPIIIILRNPVYRAYSAYSYLRRDSREKLTFREALQEEEFRLKQNWDFMWGYKSASMYSSSVETYHRMFTNVKVIFFEDFVSDPLNETSRICEFLGLDQLISLRATKHNGSGEPSNIFARFILNRDNRISLLLREWLKSYVPRTILEKVGNASLSKVKISEDDFQYLINYFEDDIKKLEKYLNKDLSSWKIWRRN